MGPKRKRGTKSVERIDVGQQLEKLIKRSMDEEADQQQIIAEALARMALLMMRIADSLDRLLDSEERPNKLRSGHHIDQEEREETRHRILNKTNARRRPEEDEEE